MLRWLTILGIVLLIPYYLCYQLWAAASWNVVFLAINLFRLVPIHKKLGVDHEQEQKEEAIQDQEDSQTTQGYHSKHL